MFLPNSQTALIFNIQHFCLHDGPGIRTTVFFNGCPLRCPWCCNPEALNTKPVLLHDITKCTFCHRCESICKQAAIEINESNWKLKQELCDSCGKCTEMCLNEALKLSGKIYHIHDVFEEVKKDIEFYKTSGGGVTLSGGEVLTQIEFAEQLSEALHKEKIHVACETTACSTPDKFERLLKVIDYFMIDLKHYNKEKLEKVCNGNLELINKNIEKVLLSGKPVVGRIPVIPGFNFSMNDMKEYAKYAAKLGIQEIHLLPFHQLGEMKYIQLNKEYKMKGYMPLHKEDLIPYADYFTNIGLTVQIGG